MKMETGKGRKEKGEGSTERQKDGRTEGQKDRNTVAQSYAEETQRDTEKKTADLEQLTIDNSQLTIKEEEPGLGETEEHTPVVENRKQKKENRKENVHTPLSPLDRGDESGRRDWEGIGEDIQNEFYGLCSVLVSKIKDFRCDNEKTGLDGMIKTTESMAKLILSIENLKTELWLKDNERAIIEKSFNDLKNEDLSVVLQNYLMYMEMIGEEQLTINN